MAGRIARLSARSPRALLALLAALAVALSVYAVGVPGRLALGGGQLAGSESEEADAILAAELGYDPQPAFLVVLTAGEPTSTATADVAIDTVRGEIKAIPGVAAVSERARSANARTTTLAVHLARDPDPDTVSAVGDALAGSLDPGPLKLLVGGSVPNQDDARGTALDEAPKLLALIVPLLLLILVGALGLRAALATLLGAVLAAAGSLAALGLIGELGDLRALATIGSGLLAALLAVQVGAGLLFRYREEAATLGPGAEALEYSLHTVLRGAAIGAFSAALLGGAMLTIPIEVVRSVGIGVIAAAVLGPPLGLLPVAAALSMRPAAGVGEALPLVADDAPVERAPLAFRALLAIGRGRRRGIVALIPLMIVAALALPIIDSKAIGLSGAELPPDTAAARAQAEIAGAFGPGASGPLIVLTDGPGEAPTVTIYRDAIAQLAEIDSVGRAATVGLFASFQAVPDSLPQSLAAQGAVGDVRAVPPPSPRRVGGPAAELTDAAGRIGSDLPLVGLFALLGTAALWSLLFRSAFGPLLAFSALIAPLAGIAAMIGVFSHARLTGLLDYQASGAPHLQSYLIVGAVLGALALARGADLAAALREERTLGGGAAGSLARSGLLTLMPIAVATLVGVALAGVWLGSALLGAKELAVGLGAGLLADLLIARTLLAPALARISM